MLISPRGFFTISDPRRKNTPDEVKKAIVEKLFIRARAMARVRLIVQHKGLALR